MKTNKEISLSDEFEKVKAICENIEKLTNSEKLADKIQSVNLLMQLYQKSIADENSNTCVELTNLLKNQLSVLGPKVKKAIENEFRMILKKCGYPNRAITQSVQPIDRESISIQLSSQNSQNTASSDENTDKNSSLHSTLDTHSEIKSPANAQNSNTSTENSFASQTSDSSDKSSDNQAQSSSSDSSSASELISKSQEPKIERANLMLNSIRVLSLLLLELQMLINQNSSPKQGSERKDSEKSSEVEFSPLSAPFLTEDVPLPVALLCEPMIDRLVFHFFSEEEKNQLTLFHSKKSEEASTTQTDSEEKEEALAFTSQRDKPELILTYAANMLKKHRSFFVGEVTEILREDKEKRGKRSNPKEGHVGPFDNNVDAWTMCVHFVIKPICFKLKEDLASILFHSRLDYRLTKHSSLSASSSSSSSSSTSPIQKTLPPPAYSKESVKADLFDSNVKLESVIDASLYVHSFTSLPNDDSFEPSSSSSSSSSKSSSSNSSPSISVSEAASVLQHTFNEMIQFEKQLHELLHIQSDSIAPSYLSSSEASSAQSESQTESQADSDSNSLNDISVLRILSSSAPLFSLWVRMEKQALFDREEEIFGDIQMFSPAFDFSLDPYHVPRFAYFFHLLLVGCIDHIRILPSSAAMGVYYASVIGPVCKRVGKRMEMLLKEMRASDPSFARLSPETPLSRLAVLGAVPQAAGYPSAHTTQTALHDTASLLSEPVLKKLHSSASAAFAEESSSSSSSSSLLSSNDLSQLNMRLLPSFQASKPLLASTPHSFDNPLNISRNNVLLVNALELIITLLKKEDSEPILIGLNEFLKVHPSFTPSAPSHKPTASLLYASELSLTPSSTHSTQNTGEAEGIFSNEEVLFERLKKTAVNTLADIVLSGFDKASEPYRKQNAIFTGADLPESDFDDVTPEFAIPLVSLQRTIRVIIQFLSPSLITTFWTSLAKKIDSFMVSFITTQQNLEMSSTGIRQFISDCEYLADAFDEFSSNPVNFFPQLRSLLNRLVADPKSLETIRSEAKPQHET